MDSFFMEDTVRRQDEMLSQENIQVAILLRHVPGTKN